MNFKNLFLSGMILALSGSLFSSCSDDETEPSNYFTLGSSKKLELSQFVLFYDPTSLFEDVYYHKIYLMSGGFQIENTEEENIITGSGNALTFVIPSETEDDFAPGEYQITAPAAGPFEDRFNILFFDVATGDSGIRYVFTAGTLNITKEGNSYTIEISATVYPPIIEEGEVMGPDLEEDPIEITGFYSGTLEKYLEL